MSNPMDHNTSDDYKKVISSDITDNYQCKECYSCFPSEKSYSQY